MIYEVYIPFEADRRKWLKISSPNYLPLQTGVKKEHIFLIEYVFNKKPDNYSNINVNIFKEFDISYETDIDSENSNSVQVVTTYSKLVKVISKIIEVENYALECSKDS